MAGTNDFLPFGTGGGANVIDQATYAALTARSSGFSSGVAQSAQLNKVWRQSSVMASALAQFIADRSGQDVLDNGATATILANLKASAAEINGDNTKTFSVAAATSGAHAPQAQQIHGMSMVRNLRGNNNATTPNTKFDLSADSMVFTGGNIPPTRKNAVSGTVDFALAGPVANGRDQPTAFPANSEVNIFGAVHATSGATMMTASLVDPPALPPGYVQACYLTTVMTDSSGNIRPMYIAGCKNFWNTGTGVRLFQNGINTSFSSQSLVSVLPVKALRPILSVGFSLSNTANFTFNVVIKPTGSADTVGQAVIRGSVAANQNLDSENTFEFVAGASRSVDTKTNGAASIGGYYMDSMGYVVPNGDN